MKIRIKDDRLYSKLNFFLCHWPILLILSAWFIFASPYFLQGKVPYSSTYQVNHFSPWSTYEKFWGPVKNGAMPDVISQIYPWKHFTVETWKSGQVPLWNPYSFSGTPHLANYQSAVFSLANILFLFLPFVDGWSILVLLQPLLAGVFTYIFCRAILISKPGSTISSIAFMFCGFLTTWMGYGTLGYAILFLPLAFFCIEKYYQTYRSRFLFLLSLTIPLSFFSGHFQSSLYFFLFILFYALHKFILNKKIASFTLIALSIFFGLLISMPQLLPSIESYLQSFRSDIFQKTEAIPLDYLPTFIAPDFFGNPVTRNDWYGHYAEWSSYIGVLPLLLAAYSFVRRRYSVTIFFTLAALAAILLAFDSFLLTLIVKLKIPVLSTSAASRAIVLFSFSAAILSGIGLDLLIEDLKNRRKKFFTVWTLLGLCIFVLLWIIVIFKINLPEDKTNIARSNLLLPTALFLGSFGALMIGMLVSKSRLFLISLFLIFLTMFDLVRFAVKWQPFDPRELVYPEIPVTKQFTHIAGSERSIGNYGAEVSVYYHLPSVEGYDAVYIRRYGQFLASISDGKIKDSYRSVAQFPKNSALTSRAVQLLGIKYVIHKRSDDNTSWTFPFWLYPKGEFKLKWEDDRYQIFENSKINPRVSLVSSYTVQKDSQKILDKLFSDSFNPRENVVLEQDPMLDNKLSLSGIARIDQYTPNKIKVNVNSLSKAILTLSDAYYPGWKAFVDAEEVPIYRANFAFRAVVLPAGSHEVTFVYDPLSFRSGLYLSVMGLFGVFFLLLLSKKNLFR